MDLGESNSPVRSTHRPEVRALTQTRGTGDKATLSNWCVCPHKLYSYLIRTHQCRYSIVELNEINVSSLLWQISEELELWLDYTELNELKMMQDHSSLWSILSHLQAKSSMISIMKMEVMKTAMCITFF